MDVNVNTKVEMGSNWSCSFKVWGLNVFNKFVMGIIGSCWLTWVACSIHIEDDVLEHFK